VIALERAVDGRALNALRKPGARTVGVNAAASVASSGTVLVATSQPARSATARTALIFLRPISFERAISRSESPCRIRSRICRYWYISNLRLPTVRLRAKARR
jgi:hypothetical protein